MTAAETRQSFLEFFREKQHAIVPSSSLLPSSPNLLFTNAGMNQFVPYFLGTDTPPYKPARAADTQKCIRAGGKHNDLDDVGLDTYHHTFFEMLGNWSFGDYFKKEAIAWAWELVVTRWKFPANRLYATVYCPHMDRGLWEQELKFVKTTVLDNKGEIQGSDYQDKFRNAEIAGTQAFAGLLKEGSDIEAAQFWFQLFHAAGLDPFVQIVPGNKKDNFWMMGDTGPCGPCSELHVDLTPAGDTRGSLVNMGDARCIEIWNLVFIQFNAEPDGSFRPLPARHVDTGMGFERVCSIIQGTKGFTDFTGTISNYDTDVFAPIFRRIAELSGKEYFSSLPPSPTNLPLPQAKGRLLSAEQIAFDIAFRVVGDHIRTLCFSIADGIIPSNNDRGYVLRRILRRAVRYGRQLGLGGKDTPSFLAELADSVLYAFGPTFPELIKNRERIRTTLATEEAAFMKTLDVGIDLFEKFTLLQTTLKTIARIGLAQANAFVDRLQKIGLNRSSEDPLPLYGEIREFGQHLKEQAKTLDEDLFDQIARGDELRILRLGDELNEAADASLELCGPTKATNVAIRATIHSVVETARVIAELNRFDSPLLAEVAFKLYDTYGFPLDLTELMARERGLSVDTAGFEALMEQQRARARAARRTEIVAAEGNEPESTAKTEFVGYEMDHCKTRVLAYQERGEDTFAVVDRSPFYAEMGGQVGDSGLLLLKNERVPVLNTLKRGGTFYLKLQSPPAVLPGEFPAPAILQVDEPRRRAIEAHHSATHLLHWALHEIVGPDAAQKGSYVGPDRLRFDFNSAALTPAQVADVERLVNEHALANVPVSWREVPYAEVRGRADIMQFFGDKYGDTVRVVQIGGEPGALNGFSMELCAGTHVRATGQLGAFKIISEGAIAAGVRRIEAVAGRAAVEWFARRDAEQSGKVRELEAKVLELNKALERERAAVLKREAGGKAAEMLARVDAGAAVPRLFEKVPLGESGNAELLVTLAEALKERGFRGVIVLAGVGGGADTVPLLVATTAEFAGQFPAGKLLGQLAPLVGGKGGGRPDMARGAGREPGKVDAMLARAAELLTVTKVRDEEEI